jgi:hypothetical protein
MLAVAETVRQEDRQDKEEWSEQDEWREEAPRSTELRQRAEQEFGAMLAFVDEAASARGYEATENELIGRVFRLARLLIALFLCLASKRMVVPERLTKGRAKYRRQPAKPRLLGTFFGKVRYWRAYLHQTNGRGGGYFPLDLRLGLTADGFSIGVLSRVVRLATKMSFAVATQVMASFLRWAPATKSVERAVLGMGRYTAEWFEQAEAPKGDGEVLVIQIDGKATPTATEGELKKRRGKRRANPLRGSARHRGRQKRARRERKKRRKKGDKSKNGRQTTVLVMYTLRPDVIDGEAVLRGPINRRIYASYAPKRHAFAIARREADKRGFTEESGRVIQIVTDGDEDYARYVQELFPTAIHTVDIIHVIERLWAAAGCLFREGSPELKDWVEMQKDALYQGRIDDILYDLGFEHALMKEGRKRTRLEKTANYLEKRTHMMNYDELIERDLELSSGAVEGAVRFVVSQRFDEGGMRWIRERAEPLLQLRCIEINGDWDAFVAFVHAKISAKQARTSRPQRLLSKNPKPLTSWGLT